MKEVLTPETMAALPAEWQDRVKQAAETADVEELLDVIEQSRERDASLADDFKYDEILTLLPH